MSTTEPKAGEWWWVEVANTPGKVWAMKRTDDGYWRNGSGIFAQREIHPIARIPGPPAPEPTEAEKIDARRESFFFMKFPHSSAAYCRELAYELRKKDEAAGYVLVPTEGPGFERMVRAMRAVDDGISTGYADWLRAALEAAKGDA